jgi:hypothetical protein
MSFLQQQTAWVLRFFVFPGTKSGVEGWSSQQGRKEGRRRKEEEARFSSKADNNNF